MAKDATMDVLFGLQKTAETKIFDFLNPQLYNIEDMDSKDCMISLAFSGCYVLAIYRLIVDIYKFPKLFRLGPLMVLA